MVVLWAGTNGYLDSIPVERIRDFETEFIKHLRLKEKKLLSEIAEKKELSQKNVKELEQLMTNFKKVFK